MKPFEEGEIKKALDQLIKQLELNFVEFKGITTDFPFERNQERIEKPRFNIIRKYHVPQSYNIEFEFMTDAAGRAKWVGKRIILTEGLSNVHYIKVLIHEWTHMRLHLTNNAVKIDKSIGEVEAESVSFIIMALLGFTDDGEKDWNLNESLKYIIRYIKESGKTIDEIYKFSGKRIERNVNHILNKYLVSAYK